MPRSLGFAFISRRDAVLHEPGEVVAHAGLPGLVTKETRDDAVFDVAAHAGDDVFLITQHHVADAGAHDHDHASRFGDRRRRDGHMRIHIGNGHRSAGLETGPCGSLFGQSAGAIADGLDVTRSFSHRQHFPAAGRAP